MRRRTTAGEAPAAIAERGNGWAGLIAVTVLTGLYVAALQLLQAPFAWTTAVYLFATSAIFSAKKALPLAILFVVCVLFSFVLDYVFTAVPLHRHLRITVSDMGHLLSSFAEMFHPLTFMYLSLGVFVGIIAGAIPGVSGAMVIALTLPLTYFMDNLSALVLLVSMYVGSTSGGLISATLMRMPGTPAAMMTVLDGFPMAKKGQPGRALGFGIMSSFVGGLISWVFLATLVAAAGRNFRPLRAVRHLLRDPRRLDADQRRQPGIDGPRPHLGPAGRACRHRGRRRRLRRGAADLRLH